MPREKLRILLQQLHEELDGTDGVEEKDRELLRTLTGDIDRALAAGSTESGAAAASGETGGAGTSSETGVTGASGDEDEGSLLERVDGEIKRFEGTHPTLSARLGRVLDQLSKLGI